MTAGGLARLMADASTPHQGGVSTNLPCNALGVDLPRWGRGLGSLGAWPFRNTVILGHGRAWERAAGDGLSTSQT
jgi:hypothetical protein